MSKPSDYSGMAALTICESLMLALNDHNVLPESDILGILDDAATSHENGVGTVAEIQTHKAVAEIIRNI